MSFPITSVGEHEFPALLREIPQPPKALNYRGVLPSPNIHLLSVVGSRAYTAYGKQVIDELIGGLKGYPIGIVSGLALGVDSLSHIAALQNNLYTLAIPGGGLSDETLYPATHKPLARRILEAGQGHVRIGHEGRQDHPRGVPQRTLRDQGGGTGQRDEEFQRRDGARRRRGRHPEPRRKSLRHDYRVEKRCRQIIDHRA